MRAQYKGSDNPFGRRAPAFATLFLQSRMRIVFAGTPDFAAVALDAIVSAAPDAGWTVPLVLTQPDRPAGRGMKMQASPVKQLALSHGLEVDTPSSLRKGDSAVAAQARLKAVAPDVLVVAAYGLILPPEVLAIPRGLRAGWQPKLNRAEHSRFAVAALAWSSAGCARDRGGRPGNRHHPHADGRRSRHRADAGAERVSIAPDDTTATLTARLAESRRTHDRRSASSASTRWLPLAQPEGATYATKLSKSEAWLDWSQSATDLERKVRAFDPFPVASSLFDGSTIRIWRAHAGTRASAGADPGCVTRGRCFRSARRVRVRRAGDNRAAACQWQAHRGARICQRLSDQGRRSLRQPAYAAYSE